MHFKNSSEYLTRGSLQLFIIQMKFFTAELGVEKFSSSSEELQTFFPFSLLDGVLF